MLGEGWEPQSVSSCNLSRPGNIWTLEARNSKIRLAKMAAAVLHLGLVVQQGRNSFAPGAAFSNLFFELLDCKLHNRSQFIP